MGAQAARRALSRRWVLLVAGMIAVGTVVRVVLAFTTYGARVDVDAYRLVYEGFVQHHLHMYSAVNPRGAGGKAVIHWPYPPGFLPWIAVSRELQLHAGVAFHTLIKLPAIAADGALAWVVQDALGWQGRPPRERLGACALIALGPIFAFISGYHGQIDAVSVLPAVVAVYGWYRWPARSRPLLCGLLIGIGVAIKPIPVLAVIPLIAVATTWRDRLVLAASTVAVPALLFVPFAVADLQGVLDLRRYGGFPGLGGISLLVQPTLVLRHLRGPVYVSDAERFLIAHGTMFTLVATAVVVAILLRARLRPWHGEYVLFLAFIVVFPFYARSYLVWLLPWVVLAGHLRLAAVIQALGFGAAISGFYLPDTRVLHLTFLMALLAVAAGATAIAVAGAWREGSNRRHVAGVENTTGSRSGRRS